MEETLEGSLQRIFGGRPPDAVAAAAAGAPAPAAGAGRVDATQQRLAAQALEHLTRARDHFGRGNWSGFATEFKQMEDVLRRLQER